MTVTQFNYCIDDLIWCQKEEKSVYCPYCPLGLLVCNLSLTCPGHLVAIISPWWPVIRQCFRRRWPRVRPATMSMMMTMMWPRFCGFQFRNLCFWVAHLSLADLFLSSRFFPLLSNLVCLSMIKEPQSSAFPCLFWSFSATFWLSNINTLIVPVSLGLTCLLCGWYLLHLSVYGRRAGLPTDLHLLKGFFSAATPHVTFFPRLVRCEQVPTADDQIALGMSLKLLAFVGWPFFYPFMFPISKQFIELMMSIIR